MAGQIHNRLGCRQQVNLSLDDARQIIITQQLLANFSGSALDAVNHLGYVQIDTICVVERAHNHILWSRSPDFLPSHLDDLHRTRKAVFEYWAHAMAYLPVADYRFTLPIQKRFLEREDCQEILAANKKLVKDIRKKITAEGPVSASDFATPEEFKGSGGWWNRKPAKQILEVLYWQGELMISHRKNFKRYYDLTDRVLTLSEIDTTMPSADETLRHHLLRVFRTLGVACKADLLWFVKDRVTAMRVLAEMINAGEVSPVEIESLDDHYYALPSVLQSCSSAATNGPEQYMHILSPFDNMIIRRDFIKRLFNFDYVFECYVPEKNRKFGYFSCPILLGTELIGTIDAKADRTRKEFIVKNLHLTNLHAAARQKKFQLEAIASRIRDFSCFNGCDSIKMECKNTQARQVEKFLKKA